MNKELLEAQENLASNTEMIAVLLTSYRQSLIGKGVESKLADTLMADCAWLYWKNLFESTTRPK